jgi:hypothetical protein
MLFNGEISLEANPTSNVTLRNGDPRLREDKSGETPE